MRNLCYGGGEMTQVVRQKWLLVLVAFNTGLALTALLLIGLAGGDRRRDAEVTAANHDAELRGVRAEIEGLRVEVESLRGLRVAIEELKAASQKQESPRESELSRTLQLIASEQQLLMVRALQPPAAKSKPAARRSTRRLPRVVCPVK